MNIIVILTATETEMLPIARQLGLRRQSRTCFSGEFERGERGSRGSRGDHRESRGKSDGVDGIGKPGDLGKVPVEEPGEIPGKMPGGTGGSGARVLGQVTGIGPTRAARAVRLIIEKYHPAHLVFAGFAGSLQPDLEVGSIVAPAQVMDLQHHCYAVVGGMPGRLLSVDQMVTTAAAKKALASQFDAVAVDMESAAAAREADAFAVPLSLVRAISDTADEALPRWLEGCVDAEGLAKPGRIAGKLIVAPWRGWTLWKLAKASRVAGESLAYWIESKMPQWTD